MNPLDELLGITPPPKRDPPDFWNMVARQKHGAPEGWVWRSLETLGDPRADSTDRQILIEGYVPNGVITKGPRKGQPGPETPGTRLKFVCTDAERRATQAEWERSTGKCGDCGGSGVGYSCWSQARQETFIHPCKCNGTGKP